MNKSKQQSTMILAPTLIRWRCHRGMLELDLLLLSFFDTYYALLTVQSQKLFIKLLECADPDLFAWLLKLNPPPEEFASLVRDIRAFHGTKNVTEVD